MKILILGAGMMGRAIAFDLVKYSNFDTITLADKDYSVLKTAKFITSKKIKLQKIDTNQDIKTIFYKNDIIISAIPYKFNLYLTKMAIKTKTNFLDLGGNNDVVKYQLAISNKAKKNKVIVIPDCGLAPGLTSVITRDIVQTMDRINFVKIRVGGLPINPKPPFDYQIVFSPSGLINEYTEKSIVLDHGKIIEKESMTEIEPISFLSPFEKMEAFLTSGGCSTMPYVYKDKIDFLDYKTIRYPGHCESFKILLSIGLGDENPIIIGNKKIIPREVFSALLLKSLPQNGDDVVLLKIISEGTIKGNKKRLEYTMIDQYDKNNNITAMMRTTAYPTSIIAQMIENKLITKHGVFCPHEIVPCKPFFTEIKKRDIKIEKKLTSI